LKNQPFWVSTTPARAGEAWTISGFFFGGGGRRQGYEMNFKSLSISTKLALAFAAVVLIIVAMSTATLWNLARIEGANGEAEASKSRAATAMNARLSLARVENSWRGYLLSNDDYYTERVEKHEGALRDRLSELRQLEADRPAQLAAIDQIAAGFDRYRAEIIDAGR
jgi:methyl-accepting chemotaxis protein